MADPFDKSAILDSFVAEVQSYLPRIKADVDGLLADPAQEGLLEEGHRLAHTVKNSSLMMGYANLGKIVQPIELLLGETVETRGQIGNEAAATIRRSLVRTGVILDGLKGEWIDDERLLQENENDFKRLRELLVQAGRTEPQVMPLALEPVPPAVETAGVAESTETPIVEALGVSPSAPPPADEVIAPSSAEEIFVEITPPAENVISADVDAQSADEEQEAATMAPETGPLDYLPFHKSWPVPVDADWPDDEETDHSDDDRGPVADLAAVEDFQYSAVPLPEIVEALPIPLPPDSVFSDAVAQLQACRERLDTLFDRIQGQLLDANRVMDSLTALKPVTMNMALLSDRRYAQLMSLAQSMAAPLTDFATAIGELTPVGAAVENIAVTLQKMMKPQALELASAVDAGTTGQADGLGSEDVPAAEAAADALAVDLAELRSAVESELREAIRRETAAEREITAQQERRSRERYEVELRAGLEAEIRAELTAQFAHAARIASLPVTRSLSVTDTPEDDQETFEDLPQELVEALRLEAEDHLSNISRDLAALERSPGNRDVLRSIRRTVHTLKGAAASMGFRVTGELAHSLEDLLDEVDEGRIAVDAAIESLILATFNGLETLVASALAGEKEDRGQLLALKPRFEEILAPVRAGVEPAKAPAQETAPQTGGEAMPAPWAGGLQVHVGIGLLDEVANLVGEMVINRAVFEHRTSDLKHALGDLDLNTRRLRQLSQKLSTSYDAGTVLRGDGRRHGPQPSPDSKKVPSWGAGLSQRGLPAGRGDARSGPSGDGKAPDHRVEFDELELDRYSEFYLLTRELAEACSDTGTVGDEMDTLVAQLDTALARQSRLNAELQGRLMHLRLVPLSTLTPRLYRAVRNVALAHGKDVEFVLVGENVEIDKTVLENVSDPLLHLVRNAVGHGIELPDERQEVGKAEKGRITLEACQEGNQVMIKVSDDGRGIVWTDVYEAAVAKGFIRDGDQLSEAQIQDLLFLPGLSTATEVSETSGRGMGLDIVRAKVSQVRGKVQVESKPGEGTTFTIRLPLTLAVVRAQLIKSGTETFAVPLGQIERIVRLSTLDLEAVDANGEVSVGGTTYPALKLDEVLGLPKPPGPAKRSLLAIVVGTESRQVAMVVDEILGQQEIVIKPLGSLFKSLRGFSGATILGNGHVVMILNAADFLMDGGSLSPAMPASVLPLVDEGSLNILVVDDSPTVRRVVCNMLQKAGYNPASARDGVEALEMVQAKQPDAILLDIEMPRMDGYELLNVLRNQAAYKGIPVVILTSRSGDKHRQKAKQLGANGYLVKPYKDEELISALKDVVGAGAN